MDKYLKPAHEGLIVRYPSNFAILPADGAYVPYVGRDGRYWRRCVNSGDCVECKPKAVKKEIKKEFEQKNEEEINNKKYKQRR